MYVGPKSGDSGEGGGGPVGSTVSKVPKPPIANCDGFTADGSSSGPGAGAASGAGGGRKFNPDKWNAAPAQKFYIYAGGAFEYQPLLACYREKFKVDVWRDERMWELAQNAGALWVHEQLKRHRLRTLDPGEAALFVIPVDGWLSQKAGPCNGHTHEARMNQLHAALHAQSWFKRKVRAAPK